MARVLLLFGGRSAEHEVSCMSAVAVIEALETAAHQVIPVGIARSGDWFLADRSRRPMSAVGRPVTFELPSGMLHSGRDRIEFDVVFPVLHGPYGEDGTIQGVFEIAGVPYVGCPVLASAASMDKDVAKRLAAEAGIPTAHSRTVRIDAFRNDPAGSVDDVSRALGLPVFVKPARLGSSVGVSKAGTDAELKEGLEEAFRHGPKAVVEEAVVGREIEVAVLEGPRASVPGEIVINAEWYDYETKYRDQTSRFVAPADLTDQESAVVRDFACRAFSALECRGLARVDFFLEQGGRGFLFNEINTMPGFTPISGFPAMWLATGMSYPDLCNQLVADALA